MGDHSADQRAGRVDRIGQRSEQIVCYTFLPAEGVERIIRLRARIRQRLQANAEVIGTDEAFFEDDQNDQVIRDLFTEKANVLEGDADSEIDLASYAYQIWKNAITAEPKLQQIIPDLPAVVYASKDLRTFRAGLGDLSDSASRALVAPEGVLVYVRTAEGNDALAWVDTQGAVSPDPSSRFSKLPSVPRRLPPSRVTRCTMNSFNKV